MGKKIAKLFTRAMATWIFIGAILFTCTLEIYGNKVGWFHFDPTMLELNTILSLWAAVQGSIIMINQNEADGDRDKMMKKMLEVEEKVEMQEETIIANQEKILSLLGEGK